MFQPDCPALLAVRLLPKVAEMASKSRVEAVTFDCLHRGIRTIITYYHLPIILGLPLSNDLNRVLLAGAAWF